MNNSKPYVFKPYNFQALFNTIEQIKGNNVIIKQKPIPPDPIKNKLIIYTINSELESIKELGFDTYTYLGKPIEDLKNSVVLRAGNSQLAFNRNRKIGEFNNVLNSAEAIKLNVRKDKALKELSKVVNTPKLWIARQKVPKNETVVLRSNSHSGGEGFKVIKGGFVVANGYHATRYLKCNQEYRLFWCMGKMFLASRITDSKKLLNQEYKCRSMWGYQFWCGIPKRLRDIGNNAYKVLKLDFCCYDIILHKGKYYVLEGNSSPTIGDFEIKNFYKKALISGIKNRFPKLKIELPNKIRKTKIETIW